jgi:translocation and assembly module TamA
MSAGVQAARVDVEVEGLDDEMRDAVRSTLQLSDYGKRDISAAELRAAFKNADQQIRQALEPFGFYDVEVDKKLTGDGNAGWKGPFSGDAGQTGRGAQRRRRSARRG